jgi:hypothetical protein
MTIKNPIFLILIFCAISCGRSENGSFSENGPIPVDPPLIDHTNHVDLSEEMMTCLSDYDRSYEDIRKYSLAIGKGALKCRASEQQILSFISQSVFLQNDPNEASRRKP